MKLMGVTIGIAVLVGLIAAGCGRGTQNDASSQGMASTPASAPPAAVAPPTSMQDIDVTFKTEPDPPKVGENSFEAMVMAGGQPVTDGAVSVEFVMPAMPSMNMSEMRNTVALKHDGSGRYRGTGNVAMAGAWEATVKVTRSGQEIGSRKFPVTAK
ncbi:MAG: FixH family protein [Vicinamibacterales bacterium]